MKFLIAILLSITVADAATTYYVDSDWTGTQSGTQAQPWKTVNWTTVNTSLASSDVTVYFSARKAGSDTDQMYSASGSTTVPDSLDGTSKTDSSGHVLTLDGSSFYNTSDATPSWTAYNNVSTITVAGRAVLTNAVSKCRLNSFITQDCANAPAASPKHSNIILHGFHCVGNDGNKAITLNGDNFTVENCEVEQTASASNGPGILVVPTADGSHQGSSCFAPKETNIVIRFCVVHDTYGEAIYVGGGGDNGSGGQASPGTQGYPSHDQIYVTNNVIYSAGTRGAQGDGIDFKGGLTNYKIIGNVVTNNADILAAGIRGIVAQGEVTGTNCFCLIEGNYLRANKSEDGAIALSNSYGNHNGDVIRNNVIADDTVGGGIRVYPTQGTILLYNNTIVSNAQNAIIADGGSTIAATNNIFLSNVGNQVSTGGTYSDDYTAYNGTLGVSAGSHSITTTVAGSFTAAGTGDYSLLSGAPEKEAGLAIGSFSADINLATRPQGTLWDIGAYEFVTAGGNAAASGSRGKKGRGR